MSNIIKLLNIPEKVKTVLLIEDMEDIRANMVKDLLTLGFKREQLTEADCLAKAVGQIKARRPDLIISDWNLPDGIGFDLLVKLKATPSLKHIPYVLCTTMDDIQNILGAIQAGAAEYIVKPWDIGELRKKLTIVLNKM